MGSSGEPGPLLVLPLRLYPSGFEKSAIGRTALGPGDDGFEVTLKPKRLELANRAMRMFSSVRKDSSGERGDGERDLSLVTAIGPTPRPAPRSLVTIGGSLFPSRDDIFRGGLSPKVATEPIFGVSLTIGEYWEMGDAPLKAPGGGDSRAAGTLPRLMPFVGDAALILLCAGGAGAGRGWPRGPELPMGG
jgi:hypothetical protein